MQIQKLHYIRKNKDDIKLSLNIVVKTETKKHSTKLAIHIKCIGHLSATEKTELHLDKDQTDC